MDTRVDKDFHYNRRLAIVVPEIQNEIIIKENINNTFSQYDYNCSIDYCIHDGLFYCNFCKKNMCVSHAEGLGKKGEHVCTRCYNDKSVNNFIFAVENHNKKKSEIRKMRDCFVEFISFEWTRITNKRKIMPGYG